MYKLKQHTTVNIMHDSVICITYYETIEVTHGGGGVRELQGLYARATPTG